LSDGKGNSGTTGYRFAGGFYSASEREFRGFAYAEVTGPIGPSQEQTVTRTWFHQGNDVDHNNNPQVSVGYMKGKPIVEEVDDYIAGQSTGYRSRHSTYASGPSSPPFFNPVSVQQNFTCEGSECHESDTMYSYDVYGNVIRLSEYGDTSDPSQNRDTIRSFEFNTTDWLVGYLAQETVYDGIGPSATAVQAIAYFYDSTSDCWTPSTSHVPSKGNVTRIAQWLATGSNPQVLMNYDAYGNPICKLDANGNLTTTGYDGSATFPIWTRNALGQTTYTYYYGVNGVPQDQGLYGQVRNSLDPNNALTSYVYDSFGRPWYTYFPDGSYTGLAYNNFGDINGQNVQRFNSQGLSRWTFFDGFGRTYQQWDSGPDSQTIVVQTLYDNRGAVRQRSLPYFLGGSSSMTTFSYDAAGRPALIQNPDGTTVASCTQNRVTVRIDARHHRQRIARDGFGRVIRIDDYADTYATCTTDLGTPYSTMWRQYDVLGNLRYAWDAANNQTEMRYDTIGRKTFMYDPDMGTWTYQYDAAGNLSRQTDANGRTSFFRYDQLNRLVQKDFDVQKPWGNGDVVYSYDGSGGYRQGRLAARQDTTGTLSFLYDAMGRTIETDRTIDGLTYTTQFGYDASSRPSTLRYPDGTTLTYQYNGPFLQSLSDSQPYLSYSGYNALGQPATAKYGNGINIVMTYAVGNAPCGRDTFRLCTLQASTSSGQVLQSMSYQYDERGNITRIDDGTSGTQSFAYDGLDRLIAAAGSSYGSLSYSYNAVGNMLQNAAIPYTYSTTTSVQPHAVVTAGPNTYSYDNNGNLITGGNRTYTYDATNHVSSVTANGSATSYVNDGDGTRVKKIIGSTVPTYINKYYECVNGSCVKFVWDNGHRIAMRQVANGVVDYFLPDQQGSTRVMTTATATDEEDISYAPFGGLASDNGSINEPYKYTGKEADSSGLYFYESRYYDPALASYISPDSIAPNMAEFQSLKYTRRTGMPRG
jgi:RHS repeat-associated protein